MPTVPPHAYTRPGQVAADKPAPDECMICGAPERAHGSTWHVFIHSGDVTTSYITRADSELHAAAIAGAEHGDSGRIDGVDIEPWEAP